MANASTKRRRWTIVLFLVTWTSLCACCLTLPWTGLPRPPLPRRGLVFEASPNTVSRAQGKLGFVDSDGTGSKLVGLVGSTSGRPVWSPDCSRIAYRWYTGPLDWGTRGPIDVLLDWRLFTIGESCAWGDTQGGGKARWTPDGEAIVAVVPGRPVPEYISEGLESGGAYVIGRTGQGYAQATRKERFDRIAKVRTGFMGCHVSETLVESGKNELLEDASLSVHGDLAYVSVPYPREPPERIMVMEAGSEVGREIGKGTAPSWSPDGEWLAYTSEEGIRVVRRDGSEGRLVVPYPQAISYSFGWPPLPEWSPDGKWLVYHRGFDRDKRGEPQRYAIFKVNLETGEEFKIVDDGVNPHWCWGRK